MAPSGGGDGNGKDPTLAALLDVVAELRGTNARLDRVEVSLSSRLDSVTSRLDRVETSLTSRLDRVEQVLVETRQEQRAGFADLRTGLGDLRGEVHEGFAELGQTIESAASRDRHLEESVELLRDRVTRLEALKQP